MDTLFFYVVSLNVIVLLLIVYSNVKSKKPVHRKSPIKHLIIHLILLIGLFIFVVDKAVIFAQIGNDDKAMMVVALFFVAVSLLLLIFKNLVEKINFLLIIVSLLFLDFLEYLVISHINLLEFSWVLVNHILLLLAAHFLGYSFLYLKYKNKIVTEYKVL